MADSHDEWRKVNPPLFRIENHGFGSPALRRIQSQMAAKFELSGMSFLLHLEPENKPTSHWGNCLKCGAKDGTHCDNWICPYLMD